MELEKKFDILSATLNKTIENSLALGLKSFESQLDVLLTQKMDALDKRLEESFSKKMNSLKAEMNKTCNEGFASCRRKYERNNAKVAEIEKKIDKISDNARRACKLTVNGIPFKQDEDLKKIFSILSSHLGYSNPPEASIYRFKTNDRRSICMQFSTEFHKNEYLYRYLKKAIGLTLQIFPEYASNNTRIFIQSDLTSQQYKINKAAIKLKKTGEVKLIRIIEGSVMISFDGDSKFYSYDSIADFEDEVIKRNPNGNSKASNAIEKI
ncbi:CLUMA_CG003652, isoform A [Clunio marinus]|uniref:CLUMA_CG003652, isoform A n=1 Tax=Clunio marinus TaxID=568069 RepID=A0A1J1HUT0_9DIPT|nr:CLUMA_CG003652, isoform A [Clunio marinus]